MNYAFKTTPYHLSTLLILLILVSSIRLMQSFFIICTSVWRSCTAVCSEMKCERVLENIVLNHGSEGLFTRHSVLIHIHGSTWWSRWSRSTLSAGWHLSWSRTETRSAGLWTSFSCLWCDLNESEREKRSDLLWITLSSISEHRRASALRYIHTRTFANILGLNAFWQH